MAELLVLEEVHMAEAGDLHWPDPKTNSLLLSFEGEAPRQVGSFEAITAGRSATPDSLQLGSLAHPHLRLRRPLPLTVTHDGPLIIASCQALEEFGYGPHLSAAVEDFRQTVAELYDTLKADRDRLGPDLSGLWQQLQALIEER